MRRAKDRGYTILEVMIVLAVSSFMFITAVIALGGRQQEIQFTQAVRDFDSKLQDIINDVVVGFYDDPGTLDCSVPATPPEARVVLSDSGGGGQGTSTECIFIGKIIQFAPGTDQNKINVYTVVGRRNSSSGGSTSSLSDATPTVVGQAIPLDGLDALVQEHSLSWGLKITDVAGENSAPPPDSIDYGGIGFFTSFARNVGLAQVSNNNAVRYGGITVPAGTDLNQTQVQFITSANNLTDDSTLSPPDVFIDLTGEHSITICVISADSDRRAAITIGSGGNTTTRIEFDTYNEGICNG